MFRRWLIAMAGALALIAPPALAANPQVAFDTSIGKFTVELYPNAAPKFCSTAPPKVCPNCVS